MRFLGAVPNDVTGKWKVAICSCNKPSEEYVLDYYKAYYEEGDSVHCIINKELETSTCINLLGTDLNVTVHEYVSGEEYDAKLMFSGNVIKEYNTDVKTGEITKL